MNEKGGKLPMQRRETAVVLFHLQQSKIQTMYMNIEIQQDIAVEEYRAVWDQ